MRCPKCGSQEDKVIDSRGAREGATIRRRRECVTCGHRYTTYETIEKQALMVIKLDGRREEFSRDKLAASITRACQKRPVSHDQIEAAVDRIVESLGNRYEFEAPSMAIGERVMEELRGLDKVAYVRYASIYRGFEEAAEFVQEVQKLEKRRDDPAQQRLPGVPAL
jgi:transcriptional repressor NrdR